MIFEASDFFRFLKNSFPVYETFLIDINSQIDFKISVKEKAFHFRLLAIFHRGKNPVSNTNIVGTSYE
ncbi:hypothetical protein LBK6_12055 [Leptospira borgpetersenii serovar Hardjo]|nr:hypothetical protein LBK6_12055 [Leptospira borgpetersenii serovar Hardjo]AWV70811.1 hypothetical protein B9T54_12995 [Leptospira borgpetersenii serovar Hardjo-bovis]AMX62293.1 hypothetical protein LBK9_12095 [Leptospira borgpetersenii serovar Hardjo]AMX65536.1 hypothetical protein LBK30_12115 [Leptospira borgpetersenii serovar Hardjo]AMX68746.1 hypothetical protein LBHA_11945 [Leptospira borgpetersenii serovar Hardjo]